MMPDIRLDELRKQYFNSVLAVNTEEDLYAILPTMYQSNYIDLMGGIIKLLVNEMDEYLAYVQTETDAEVVAEYFAEIEMIQKKIVICEKILRESFDDELESKVDETKKVNIIFGVNPAGSISFLNDLKRNVDDHYYPEVLQMLEEIQTGNVITNQEKVRKFNSNNSKLQGLMEQKGFQLRIMFRQLPNNIVYVTMVRVKKDTRVTKDFEEPIKRTSLLAKDFENVKRRVANKDRVEELIITGQQQLQEIMEFISSKIKVEEPGFGGK